LIYRRRQKKGETMLQRREYLLGSIGTAILALGRPGAAAVEDQTLTTIKSAVGTRDKVAGMVAVIIDENGTRTLSYGSSGTPNVAMTGDTVFEIMSNTKVLTSLLLADMAGRGEVGFDDPVAKYLPTAVTLHERGGQITLLDLATYTSGLPNVPANLPPDWYASAAPMANYTQDQLFAFLSEYMPEHAPGTHYEYANLGFGLLGIALATRAGMSYEKLLVERICDPLGLAHTRITLTDDMRRHLAQGHDLGMKPTQLWDWPAMPGGGCVRSTAKDLTVFLKACIGLSHTSLSGPLARLVETKRPTSLPGTRAGLGWFVTSDDDDEIIWKSGLSMGCNTFIGFSKQRRRGVVLLANFLWQPLDAGTITLGVKLIKPDFREVDFNALYPH
jgi:D-alanyl-D-alanine-carboxypeptidase/D-alanyl-D-alanine-endopeptidase